jgi:hypothetical protein
MRLAALCVLAVLLGACATSRGFDRGAMKASASAAQVSDEAIAQALTVRPQLPPKYKLAVYFVPSGSAWGGPRTRKWRWTGQDKAELLKIAAPLIDKGINADVFSISESVLEGTDRLAIRLAAARAGADAVLIVDGSADVDRYNNNFGITYALIVTAAFVPGTVADGLFIATASMWDVRNDYLYLSVEAEGMVRKTAPAAFIAEDAITREAKAQAVQELGKQLALRLERMGPT